VKKCIITYVFTSSGLGRLISNNLEMPAGNLVAFVARKPNYKQNKNKITVAFPLTFQHPSG